MFDMANPNGCADPAAGSQRIETIPKNFDFIPAVEKVNQVLSYDGVNGFIEQRMSSIDQVEDSMMVTGLRMTTNTYAGTKDPANTTNSSGMRATSGGRSGVSGIQGTGMMASRSGYKIGLGPRIASNERKSSIGPDQQNIEGFSPYPRMPHQLQITKDNSAHKAD